MKHLLVLVICCSILRAESNPHFNLKALPSNLLMGAASASYQVEGAWNEDGKSENIWDRYTHTNPEKILDRSSGDIACDSYHKIDEDVAIMKELGLDFYRFSLSWSRILPSGFSNIINPAGVKYYNQLINKLLENNIIPIVTIYHWDLPQSLQDLGGFANPNIVQWSRDFAEVVFGEFGDRVKTWITFNEPQMICQFGYEQGVFAPGVQSWGVGIYQCAHNLLKAHAHIYHLYDKVFRPKQKGRVSIVTHCPWFEPATTSSDDIEAAERERQFYFGLYTHPIFHKDGDYPRVVKQFVNERSKLEGFSTSRLPKFTPLEVAFIRGTYDFFGLNHYTTFYARDTPEAPIGIPSSDKDARVEYFQDPDWLTGGGKNSTFRLVPWGLRKILSYIKHNYDNTEIFITETGFPDDHPQLDYDRIRFLNETLEAVLESVYYDDVRIEGYTAWSLLDDFEWNSGYTLRFGLYHVDFTNANRTRTPKVSARYYKDLLVRRSL